MDIEELIERLKKLSWTDNLSEFDDAATALQYLSEGSDEVNTAYAHPSSRLRHLKPLHLSGF